MSMKWLKEIQQAIEDQKDLKIVYDHQTRLVSPHILGRSTANHILLSGFQTANFDDSEFSPHWRTFDLSKIEALSITDKTFHKRYDYNPRDRNFSQVLSQL